MQRNIILSLLLAWLCACATRDASNLQRNSKVHLSDAIPISSIEHEAVLEGLRRADVILAIRGDKVKPVFGSATWNRFLKLDSFPPIVIESITLQTRADEQVLTKAVRRIKGIGR